jgi:hypothetical protein
MGWGQGGEMNQALYAHMNNKRKMKKKKMPSSTYLSTLIANCSLLSRTPQNLQDN